MSVYKNSVVLITGGTGSFGNAFLDFLTDKNCKEIRIFSRDELKQEQMRITRNEDNLKFYLGDVSDRESVDKAMRGVDFVFHAAALKQVPSCEFFPLQAVKTNVLGSHNVVESSVEHKVKKLILLSTDKAVYPINSMGMTKGLMVKVAQAKAREVLHGQTIICCVRYGNVMASRGSVIPLFIKQILNRGPITVTNPEMTRFLLPLPSAIDLVDFAFCRGSQGDLFVRKSPACTVIDLANALKELFNSDVKIKNIGIRHGEKIYETLASCEELTTAEDLGKYYRIRMDCRSLEYKKFFTEGETHAVASKDYTSHNTTRLNCEEVKALLLSLPFVSKNLEKEHDRFSRSETIKASGTIQPSSSAIV